LVWMAPPKAASSDLRPPKQYLPAVHCWHAPFKPPNPYQYWPARQLPRADLEGLALAPCDRAAVGEGVPVGVLDIVFVKLEVVESAVQEVEPRMEVVPSGQR